MAINFPNSPAVNDTFTVGGITFTFTGVKWESSAVVEVSSDSTPSLGGTLDAGTNNINNVGVITATTFSGNVTGNADTATTATYAETAGISTYATTAGVSTNAQGLTGDPSIQVTNATVLGNLDVQGTTTTIDTAVTGVDSLNVEGNVGIGTDNPSRLLDVAGSVSIAKDLVETTNVSKVLTPSHSSANRGGKIRFGLEDGSFSGIEVENTVGSNSSYNSQNVHIVSHNGGVSGDLKSLTARWDGKIGIGTTNPAAQLDVYGAGAEPVIRARRTDSNGAFNIFEGYSEVNGANVFTVSNNGAGYFAGTISDSMGPLRRLGINAQTGAYTVTTTDAGKLIRINNTGNITIPTGLSPGDMVSIVSHHNSTNTIVQDTGLTMYNTADGSTGNRTLAARGVCTILWSHTDTAYISGSGLS